MAEPTAIETQLRLELAEARTDKKFADVLGEMRAGFAGINARLDGLERSTAGIKTVVVGTGIAAVVLVVAVLAYGQTWFGLGISAHDVARAAATEALQQQQHQVPPGTGVPKL